ncbi:MAG: cytochrome c biogenesis protein ResB [Nocardioides sp.]
MTTPTTRRPGELAPVELLRFAWRQLVSMRTALVLLLLLALAAIPGSVIPQSDVDSLKTSRWQALHPQLTPVFERLGLFSVYDSPWFSAIYLLLVVSLVGCILPRSLVYWRALRAAPPDAPRRLSRLPDHATYLVDERAADVLDRAERVLRRRRYRVVTDEGWVAAERGYLREAGNLLFHISVLVVLLGFALGSLFGYRGGVIVLVGGGFSNNLTQYDEFVPGSLFDQAGMEPFSFDIDDFDVEWLRTGPARGQARSFVSHLTYRTSPEAAPREYDLKVNHPLAIGDTEIFLIGHGYAPVITIRDGNGDVAYSGPTVFLPLGGSFESFGVVKAPDARPTQIGLQGNFYPTYAFTTDPFSAFGEALNPALSLTVNLGDLGMDDGRPQSVYVIDSSGAPTVKKADGTPFRVDLMMGQTVDLPDGVGTVTFEGLERWNKVQISRSPGKLVALGGVVLALIGLLASLFIRPRRIWVRARAEQGGTLVEVAGLDRSGNGDVPTELAAVAAALELDEGPQHGEDDTP